MPQPPNAKIIIRIKKLSEIAEALRRGKVFPITRLTTIKSLCADPEAAPAFAVFLPQRIQNKMRQEHCPERYRQLVDRAVNELKPYLDEPTEERKARLALLCREMEAEQNECENIGWNLVRLLKSTDLVVVEESLRSVLNSGTAGHDLPGRVADRMIQDANEHEVAFACRFNDLTYLRNRSCSAFMVELGGEEASHLPLWRDHRLGNCAPHLLLRSKLAPWRACGWVLRDSAQQQDGTSHHLLELGHVAPAQTQGDSRRPSIVT